MLKEISLHIKTAHPTIFLVGSSKNIVTQMPFVFMLLVTTDRFVLVISGYLNTWCSILSSSIALVNNSVEMKTGILEPTSRLMKSVVELGNKNSKTLGLMPEGAIIEHAQKKRVYVVFEKDQLYGYVLFALTVSTNTIRIAHLCVSEESRGKGVGRILVDFIRTKYKEHTKGIKLSCREDFTESKAFWESYGFKCYDRVKSRSKQEKYLLKYFYDFGNPDLFSIAQDSSINKVSALIDSNIIIKLRDKKGRHSDEVNYLMGDWLIDDVEFFVAPEVQNEISRDKDHGRAKRTRQYISGYNMARFEPERRDRILKDLVDILPGNKQNDKSDRMQLAECIAADIKNFITLDEGILSQESRVFQSFGVNVLNPSDFILQMDYSLSPASYSAIRIGGTYVSYYKLKAGKLDSIARQFVETSNGEKFKSLNYDLRQIASNSEQGTVMVIEAQEQTLGFWAGIVTNNSIEIQFIRIQDQYSELLLKQLISTLIQNFASKEQFTISLTDHFLAFNLTATLHKLGFQLDKTNGNWNKKVIPKFCTLSEVHNSEALNTHVQIEKSGVVESAYFEKTLEIEKQLWPLKISDLDLPCYIVPIRPYWAGQLFDHYLASEDIFGSNPKIAWNFENVYYRNVKPISEKFPGRIVWYASSKGHKFSVRTKSVIGCSYLNSVDIGSPKSLYRKFRHLGVYEWKDIDKLSDNGNKQLIKALSFSHTEVFEKPIPLKQIQEIFRTHGRLPNTFASPVQISSTMFNSIYSIGKGLE